MEGIALAGRYLATIQTGRFAAGCPSIDPHLGYRVITLHEGCAKLDRRLFLDGKFEAQPPAADGGIWLADDILDLSFFRGDVAPYAVGVDRFEPVADQVEDEYFAVLALGTDASPHEPGQRRDLWRIRTPMQAIGVGMLTFGLQRVFWPPEAGDVVVDFFLGRNLDKLNRTLAPIPNWLRPQARSFFKAGFEILIREIILLPLHQTVTARIEIGKGADLQVPRIAEWTP